MDFIYDRTGAAIASVQQDGDRTNIFDARGKFLGWSDGEDTFAHDGALIARGPDSLALLLDH